MEKQFPANRIEALALAWATRICSNNASPEYLCQKYWEAYYRISAADSSAAEAASRLTSK